MSLRIEQLEAGYGLIQILYGIDLEIGAGEIVSLIGRNGVGKTTLLRSIMGLTRLWKGGISYKGQPLIGLAPYRIARLGIAYVPEDRGIFPQLTVGENLWLGTIASRHRNGALEEQVYRHFPALAERYRQVAGSLSGGEQQMLAIGRALMARPDLLLVDEFSEGLQPSIVDQIAEIVLEINRSGVAVLLVEQNARLALSLSKRGCVMEKGQIVHGGSSAELLRNEETLRRFLLV